MSTTITFLPKDCPVPGISITVTIDDGKQHVSMPTTLPVAKGMPEVMEWILRLAQLIDDSLITDTNKGIEITRNVNGTIKIEEYPRKKPTFEGTRGVHWETTALLPRFDVLIDRKAA